MGRPRNWFVTRIAGPIKAEAHVHPDIKVTP